MAAVTALHTMAAMGTHIRTTAVTPTLTTATTPTAAVSTVALARACSYVQIAAAFVDLRSC